MSESQQAAFCGEYKERALRLPRVTGVEFWGSIVEGKFIPGKSDLDIFVHGENIPMETKKRAKTLIRELNDKYDLGLERVPCQHPTPFFIDSWFARLLYRWFKGRFELKWLRSMVKGVAPSYGFIWRLYGRMQEEESAWVTEDRWMKEEGGRLDATDRELLVEASQNGRVRVRVINLQEMLEAMMKTQPKKYKQFRKYMEKEAGKRLTFDDLVELGRKADERMQELTEVVGGMTLGHAAQVRIWRIEGHMTWRSVARAAYLEGWFHCRWEPPSNQVMGMAICERAATFFEENYREPPWN
ncbi:hypothetical protein ES703_76456 [subsurface metagenome]